MCLENIDIAILCGGMGSRIAPVLGDIPKALAPIRSRPYLHHLCEQLKKFKAKNIVLLCGHKERAIGDWVKTRPRDELWIVRAVEPWQAGRAGALRFARGALASDPILVINGDTLLDFDICRFMEAYQRGSYSAATLISTLAKDTPCGFYILSQWFLDRLCECAEPDLDEALIRLSDEEHRLCAVHGAFDYIDIGTPQGLQRAQEG